MYLAEAHTGMEAPGTTACSGDLLVMQEGNSGCGVAKELENSRR